MNNLLNFLAKQYHWFVFIILVIMSLVMLFNNNPYQQSVYLTSANSMSTKVYSGINSVTSYIDLKDVNENLHERNAQLQMEIAQLHNEINELKLQVPDSSTQPRLQQFNYILAHVISNTTANPYNYITINRGSKDGIKPDMGVVDQNGIVGIVNVTGEHSARIISLLNPNIHLSCCLKNSEYFGSLVWDGVSPEYAVLEELPKQIKFKAGDTIMTNGYSSVFPEGIMVGTIVGRARKSTDSFLSLKIKLNTNFSQLSTVRIITNNMRDEIKALEENTITETDKEVTK